MKTILYCLLALALATGCKKNESGEPASDQAMTLTEPVPAGSGDERAAVASEDKTASAGQKIIKNADIRFESSDVGAAGRQIMAAVARYGAQVQNDTESKDEYAATRKITVRIPSNNFDAFISEIGKGVAFFDRKEISSQDVTEEYVDIEARVKAKKVLEGRYLDLIRKAVKISEILEIEKQLSVIREEIEAQEGRLRYMQSRVAMSTVSIEIYKNSALELGATVSYGSKMATAVKSGFNGLSSFFIGLLYIWPFILIFVIALIIIRKKLRKRS